MAGMFERLKDYASGHSAKKKVEAPTQEPMPMEHKATPPAGQPAGSTKGMSLMERRMKEAGAE